MPLDPKSEDTLEVLGQNVDQAGELLPRGGFLVGGAVAKVGRFGPGAGVVQFIECEVAIRVPPRFPRKYPLSSRVRSMHTTKVLVL